MCPIHNITSLHHLNILIISTITNLLVYENMSIVICTYSIFAFKRRLFHEFWPNYLILILGPPIMNFPTKVNLHSSVITWSYKLEWVVFLPITEAIELKFSSFKLQQKLWCRKIFNQHSYLFGLKQRKFLGWVTHTDVLVVEGSIVEAHRCTWSLDKNIHVGSYFIIENL